MVSSEPLLMLDSLADVTDPTLLAAAHMGAWTEDEAESACVFRLRAFHQPVIDDPRRIADFPDIEPHIQPFWMHRDPPISRMSVGEIIATTHALEWLLISDIYVIDRTAAFFDQFIDLFRLVQARAMFIVEHVYKREILDMEEYAELVVDVDSERNPEFDYDSDEEMRISARPELDTNVKKFLDPPWRANDTFVRDVDTSFRAIETALFARWSLASRLVDAPRYDLRALRHLVFKEIKDVKEQTIVNFRREWIQKILVTPENVSTHIRHFPHDRKPNPRAVLVKRNEALALVSVPTSVLDITTPPPKSDGRKGAVDMRMNTDAALFYVSGAVPNDDFVKRVWIGNVSGSDSYPEPSIGRLAAEQKFVLFYRGAAWRADSFAAAFVHFRTLARAPGVGPGPDADLGRRMDECLGLATKDEKEKNEFIKKVYEMSGGGST